MKNKSIVGVYAELVTREGVRGITIAPYETFQVVQDQRIHEFTGPAQILINIEAEPNPKTPVQKMDELEKLSAPLLEFLNNNYNPHSRIEITSDYVRVVEDVLGIPKTN